MKKRVADQPERPFRDTLVYRGKSMYPTFRELDLLCYRRGTSIRAGDVVAFPDPDSSRIVVHRVVRVTAAGLITRGDNGTTPDQSPVPLSSVLGVVCTCHRNGNLRKVHGGITGKTVASGCLVRRYGHRIAGRWVGRLYRLMIFGRIPSRWTAPCLDLQLARYDRGNGDEFQLHHHGRAVGIRRAGAERWQIYFPYTLLVDPDHLPEPPSGGTEVPPKAEDRLAGPSNESAGDL